MPTDDTAIRLNFKDMCARFEVTPRTLRYYEYIELLQPEKEGRSRFYGPTEVARMVLILRGRRFGFSLEEMRQWLELYETEGTDAQREEWRDMADRQLKILRQQRVDLDATISELEKLHRDTLGEPATE
ncbi:MerR family transcriptional regulator [Halocynthiibacter sp.]|uniref:MerR family transcriptional regulator n=1 Tax=Halocynthiibacter sp. TaxID=1979210 RepID=UPI003C43F3FE